MLKRLSLLLIVVTVCVSCVTVSKGAEPVLLGKKTDMDVIYAEAGETYEMTCVKDAELYFEALNESDVLYDWALYAWDASACYQDTSKSGYWPMNGGQVLVVQIHKGTLQLYGDLRNCFTVRCSDRDALVTRTLSAGESMRFMAHSVKTYDMYDYFKHTYIYFDTLSDSACVTHVHYHYADGFESFPDERFNGSGWIRSKEDEIVDITVSEGEIVFYVGYRNYIPGADYTAGKLITAFSRELNNEDYVPTSKLNPVSRLNEETDEMTVYVYENRNSNQKRSDDFRVSEAATIIVEGKEYLTSTEGHAIIPRVTSGEITVSKENYISRTLTASQLMVSDYKVYLQPKAEKGPVISAVWVDGVVDVLSQKYPVGLLSDENIELSVEVDWGSGRYGGILLVQEERSVSFKGDTLSVVLSDYFDVSEQIYIVAQDLEGNDTKKELKIELGSEAGIPEWMTGLSVDLGDGLSFTLPEGVKPGWMEGQKVGMGISSLLPVTVSVENGRIYMAVGVDFSEEREGSWRQGKQTMQTAKKQKHL